MRLDVVKRICLLAAAAITLISSTAAPAFSQDASVLVRTQAEFSAAVEGVRPGQTIVLADGEWRDFAVLFEGRGRPEAPITLRAQTPGRVVLTGRSNLRLAGRHLVVRGLVFRDGYSPSGEVVSFRRDRERQAFDSRVTEIVIDGFNNPSRSENEIWVVLFGRNNRVDHSHFEGKLSSGVTLAVRLDAPDSNRNRHRIDHNYFGPRPPLGSNGGETIRIGTSHNSLEDSNTIVERNIFEECSGEVEIISNKSGANIFRGNLFVRSQGSLTLRHGNNNLVEDNVFFGGGVENTGGVRVINAGQIVRNNLFVDLRGTDFAGALVVMNGVPNSPLNRYHQVRDAVIENNTFIDVSEIGFGAGADAERSLAPVSSRFRNNLVIGGPRDLFSVESSIDGIAFASNIVSTASPPAGADVGFATRALTATGGLEGLDALAALAPGVGFQLRTPLVTRAEVGVPWYEPARTVREGRVREIAPGVDAIGRALATAETGDTLALAPGAYTERGAVTIDRPVSIVALRADRRPTIRFEGSTLFALSGRAELTLRGVRISGAAAPDAAGNAVVRMSVAHPPHNYRLTLIDCEVIGLRSNRGFSVLRAEQGAFASEVRVEHSTFRDISGVALSFRGETEGFGKYNVENLIVSDTTFADLGEAAIEVLRAGKDESTFGPRVRLDRVSFSNIADGAPAARFHGVQRLMLDSVRRERAAPIEAIIEVGRPVFAENGVTLEAPWVSANLNVRDGRS